VPARPAAAPTPVAAAPPKQAIDEVRLEPEDVSGGLFGSPGKYYWLRNYSDRTIIAIVYSSAAKNTREYEVLPGGRVAVGSVHTLNQRNDYFLVRNARYK